MWRPDDPEGNEAAKIKYLIVPYTRGHVLDLGCGPSKAFPHFIGIDNCKDRELFGTEMRPDLVVPDAANLDDSIQAGSCDAVFSSHLLEHIEDWRAALASWWRCIKVGGHLVLYLPHRDLYPNIGQPGANPDHKHDFVPDDILAHFHDDHWADRSDRTAYDVIVCEERAAGTEYSFLVVIRKVTEEQFKATELFTYKLPKPAKTACVVRYGGFGDMIQASGILPALKREGYHVTVMTTPKGQEILQHDPHVDAWFIQDTDQVPNHELSAFWEVQAARFDRFINLSESIEGTLLAYPGRTNHGWPDAVRRRELGKNYFEWIAQLAEVPFALDARFYPSEGERRWVEAFLMETRLRTLNRPVRPLEYVPARFNILWTLSGSSVHKMYPHQDEVIAKILASMPEAVVILCGDTLCQLLEQGWEKHPRVRCTSGELGIRQTMALAQRVQCVVGPETGVLNAVGYEPMAKVVMLSHSSANNLTANWLNTTAVQPQDTACYPCHRLHHDRTYCPEHEPTGASMCAWNTDPRRVFDAIAEAYLAWRDNPVRRVIEQPAAQEIAA
jgi:ADP-heptose:LPS heptosyltransferase/SAM-dependent methyltransferase